MKRKLVRMRKKAKKKGIGVQPITVNIAQKLV